MCPVLFKKQFVTDQDLNTTIMKRWRRLYYDIFSSFYDRIIALHSRDRSLSLRKYLLDKSGIAEGQRLLDLCTGTGAVAIAAGRMLNGRGMVVGADFSTGMLKRAKNKALQNSIKVDFVLCDTAHLPFVSGQFHVVTCSHAMYELDPATRSGTLSEARRVLVPGGRFLMMEHMEPRTPFIRFLYRLRLASMGSAENKDFARDERPFLAHFFQDVKLELVPGGKSKIVSGRKPHDANDSRLTHS